MDMIFQATVEAVGALINRRRPEDMTANGITVRSLPHERLMFLQIALPSWI